MTENDTSILHGRISMPYRWTVGATGSRFFVTLRDEGRLTATKCSSCGGVYIPPRQWCTSCFADCSGNWVDVENSGVVVESTVVRKTSPIQPCEPPYAYALILLDGATVPMTHVVAGPGVATLAKGDRVRAVLRADRQGSIRDIEHFELDDHA